ncbi:MAG: hypothetical protein LBK53_03980 [Heliobacteriaceae bacterium]|jgi:lipoate-protein ligase A|nr:hypothetical protein [Heliobacteriaceae bacterium]
MKFIPFEVRTGQENMQIDNNLLDMAIREGLQEPIFRLYGWSPACISLGRNQRDDFLTAAETNTLVRHGKVNNLEDVIGIADKVSSPAATPPRNLLKQISTLPQGEGSLTPQTVPPLRGDRNSCKEFRGGDEGVTDYICSYLAPKSAANAFLAPVAAKISTLHPHSIRDTGSQGSFFACSLCKPFNHSTIDVVRRLTGGRALLHDDEITYSFICPASYLKNGENVKESYKEISRILVDGFAKLGIELGFGWEEGRGNRKAKKVVQSFNPSTPNVVPPLRDIVTNTLFRHCEERSDEAIQAKALEFTGLPRRADALLAMTKQCKVNNLEGVIGTADKASGPQSLRKNYCMLVSTGADLCYQGKKLIGSAQFRKEGYILQHGSILYNYDSAMLEEIFNEPVASITCIKEINPDISRTDIINMLQSLNISRAK